uniref:Uncharacterized protein n=1 Tax=Anguilla anguilla TaxID=7936 RepID=A0A0E9TKJ1_ANGAN
MCDRVVLYNLIRHFKLDEVDTSNEMLAPLFIVSYIDPRFRYFDFLTAEAKASVALAVKRACLQHPAKELLREHH